MRAIFGLAAIAAFLLALPAAAMACVSLSSCSANGGIPDSPPGNCGGGSDDGQPICPNNQFGNASLFDRTMQADLNKGDILNNLRNDPFVNFTSIQDRGAAVTSASGAISGQAASSHTTDVGGGAIGMYNGWNRTFGLAANQSLVAAAQFTYDSSHTTFGASTLTPGVLNTGSLSQKNYSLAGALMYYAGTAYFGGALSGEWGHGDETNAGTAGAGGYGTHGYSTTAIIGNVFTLFGSPVGAGTVAGGATPSTSASTAPSSALPTKALPKPAAARPAVRLDLSAHLGYENDRADGFTDSTGFISGAEQLRFWDAGGTARLFATIPDGRLIWIPNVALKLDRQFRYSDSEIIPSLADTIFYGTAQTFWGTQWGVGVQDSSGFQVGLRGTYEKSAEFQVLGGQAYLLYAFPE
jgi:hypothetical protein